MSDAGILQINPNYLPWYKQDQMLLGWLLSSLTREILPQVVSAQTSAELWSILRQTFSATSRARFSDLRRQLQNTVRGGASCLEFITKLRSIADELAFIGEPISDDDLQMHILQGLGAKFDSLVVAVQTEPARSIADLTALSYSHEALLLSRHTGGSSSLPSSDNPVALYSSKLGPKNSKSARGGYRSQTQQRGSFQQYQQRPPNSSPGLLPRPSGPRPDFI